MHPFISLFGHDFPTYGLLVVVGAVLCAIYLLTTAKRKKVAIPMIDVELAVAYGCVGAFLGASILYVWTTLPDMIADIARLFSDTRAYFGDYFGGGYVFYGGFYGGVATCAIYARVTKVDKWELARMLIPLVPFFHVLGRIGCFMAGCCYGMESETFGVVYTASLAAPNGVPLLPVQLYESVGEFILFVITSIIAWRPQRGDRAFCFWLIAYAVMRFCLEFLRGDDYRGIWGPLSTSQWIALISIAWGIVIIVRRHHSWKKPPKVITQEGVI